MAKSSIIADGLLFFTGAASAVLVFYAVLSFVSEDRSSAFSLPSFLTAQNPSPSSCRDTTHDPPAKTFYDDPTLDYTVSTPVRDWDEKRRAWLDRHPSFRPGLPVRVLMLSGSQAAPCKSPIGDHLLLRLFKNKADYCRIHGLDFFYNTALFHPKMFGYWNKIPTIRSAMLAHPEAEWIWWVDSDAAFTDMDFKLPLDKYRNHNMVVHGWPNLVYEEKSWTSLNAGVFLIRNCQWSLDLMEAWGAMGPQTSSYEKWGKTLKSELKDKLYPESDDQSGLVYLLLKEKHKWADKIYLENEYYFEGYWIEIVGRLRNMTAKYRELEKRDLVGLARRHAEAVREKYGEDLEQVLRKEGMRSGPSGLKRPLITHFVGCQPCSGNHNAMYKGEECWEGMRRVLDFADDQVLKVYGFEHAGWGKNAKGELRPRRADSASKG